MVRVRFINQSETRRSHLSYEKKDCIPALLLWLTVSNIFKTCFFLLNNLTNVFFTLCLLTCRHVNMCMGTPALQ